MNGDGNIPAGKPYACKASSQQGLRVEAQLFALRALYPLAGRTAREILPIIAALLLPGFEDPADAGHPGEQSSGPSVQAVRKSEAVP